MNESSPKSTPTASKPLTTAETLALLERLRQSVGAAVRRTDELERDFNSRSHKLRTQFAQAKLTEQARWATESEAANTDVAAKRERVEASFAARKTRIARASEGARKQRLAEIEGEESKHTLENQAALLEAERVRDADKQKIQAHHASLTNQLADECAALDQLGTRARATLAGYGSLARLITNPPSSPALDTSAPEGQLLEQLRTQRDLAAQALTRSNVFGLTLFFRFFRLWLCLPLILLVPFAFVPELRRFDYAAVSSNVWFLVGAGLVAVSSLYFLGRRLAAPHAKAAALALHSGRQLAEVCSQKAEVSFQAETTRLQAAHASTTQRLNDHWKQVRSEARILRSGWTDRLTDQARRLMLANEERQRLWLKAINEHHAEQMAQRQEETTRALEQLETGFDESLARLKLARDASRQAIESEWQCVVVPAFAALQSAAAAVDKEFPPWRAELWRQFTLPEQAAGTARFASLAVDTEKFCEVSLSGRGLALPGEPNFSVPLLLSVPRQASLLFETKQSGQEQVVGALNNLVLRLLTSTPPGRLSFTIFDPVGLGQNFAGIMHLADFEERLINSRIWTQAAQFEQRLADLNEHIEKVTQMYLRNEYETLAEYNAQAGRLAEKYNFLVIADFPSNFSEVAVKRLHSIAASGPRCGVHLLIHWDQRKTAPVEFVPEELRKNAICIVPKDDGFVIASYSSELGSSRRESAPNNRGAESQSRLTSAATADWSGVTLTLDAPPDAELATQLLQQIGKDSTDSYRVEMPFAEVAPADSELWSRETTAELRVAVGRTGATKLQYLALGQGTRQHGLIAGKTGSGKSTLFHVIITNLALWCSPEQVEFYLVDFKKGVEFKCYATHKLPHARVIAIESDREFGLSVLQRVDDELKRRGDLFRKLGAQDLAGYQRAGGTEPIPRTLLLIDEFQELFVEDDRVSQGAALLLDRIVRQGRAFGIHVLLGSQTLGGAYSLARATIGQMVVRIALQCNEADAYLIMNEDNPAPRLLSRPGEAIYNDDGGALQGNSPFQVVWLPDEVRETWLEKVRTFAERRSPTRRDSSEVTHRAGAEAGAPLREPIVFEGNAPANVSDNTSLRALLDAKSVQPGASPRIWLGAPNSIKGPTEAIFRRQSGNHLLIVGQREEAALGMLGVALVTLAAQHPKGSVRFFVFDCSAPDSAEAKFLERVVRTVPHEIKLVRAGDVDKVMTTLAAEQQQRTDDPGTATPETYLLIHGLQRNKKLRFDEEMSFSLDAGAGGNPGLQLNKLICEGASLGFHVIANCDTYNNVMRFLSRKALSEFEMRVVFQMSANDSASLIDSPQANNLGLHRAILFNGQEGWLETFRPYALPDEGWLVEAEQQLSNLRA